MIDQIRRESRAGMVSQFQQAGPGGADRGAPQAAGSQEARRGDFRRRRQAHAAGHRRSQQDDDRAVRPAPKATGFDISTLRERLQRRSRPGARSSAAASAPRSPSTRRDVDRVLSAAATEAGEDTVELQVQKITLPIPGRADQATLVRRFSEARGPAAARSTAARTWQASPRQRRDAKFEDSQVRQAEQPAGADALAAAAAPRTATCCRRRRRPTASRSMPSAGAGALKADEKQREKARQELAAEGIRDRRQAPPARPPAGSPHRVSLSAAMTAPSRASGSAKRRRRPALPLAVTMGDPAGIGPDITLAAGCSGSRAGAARRSCVYGDPRCAGRARPRSASRRAAGGGRLAG